MEITKEIIQKYSQLYNHNHGVLPQDVKKANHLKNLIEKTRNRNYPKAGDIVIVCGLKKEYPNGHIEKDEINEYSAMCVEPYKPFVFESDCKEKPIFSTSGGYWCCIPEDDLNDARKMFEYIGTKEKLFITWGHCGACGNGAFTFPATVNVWKVFLESIY